MKHRELIARITERTGLTPGASAQLQVLVADFYSKHAFQHIPCFVVAPVEVQGRDPTRLRRDAARVLPFCNHKVVGSGTEKASG